ncbi:PDZ domain-containing protein [Chloroflexota bacterium]
MIRKKKIIACILAVSLISLVLVFSLLPVPFMDSLSTDQAEDTDIVTDLGITYLRITPELSAYYGLGADSGILVTEVKSGSFMDRAQVKTGDIICSCNGVMLDNDVSLLGLLRTCSPDDKFTFEVCREEDCHYIEFCQNSGTSECTCGCSTSENE